jgi:hypothetical protein
MKKKYFLFIAIVLFTSSVIAQQIPIGSCGIVCIYDAAGNRTKRVYFCNNGLDPYPTVAPPAPQDTIYQSRAITAVAKGVSENSVNEITKSDFKNFEFREVDALYPNPTTGVFYISFSKALSNANISLLDFNGKKLKSFIASGYKITYDLSALPAGTYFVRIEEKEKVITKKIIKL